FSAWWLVGLSSLLQVLIFPLPGLYLLSWIAFAPLLVALLRAQPVGSLEIDDSVRPRAASPGQAFLLAYVCGILWYAVTCDWIYGGIRCTGCICTGPSVETGHAAPSRRGCGRGVSGGPVDQRPRSALRPCRAAGATEYSGFGGNVMDSRRF